MPLGTGRAPRRAGRPSEAPARSSRERPADRDGARHSDGRALRPRRNRAASRAPALRRPPTSATADPPVCRGAGCRAPRRSAPTPRRACPAARRSTPASASPSASAGTRLPIRRDAARTRTCRTRGCSAARGAGRSARRPARAPRESADTSPADSACRRSPAPGTTPTAPRRRGSRTSSRRSTRVKALDGPFASGARALAPEVPSLAHELVRPRHLQRVAELPPMDDPAAVLTEAPPHVADRDVDRMARDVRPFPASAIIAS